MPKEVVFFWINYRGEVRKMNKLGYKVSGAVAAALIWGSLLSPQVLADTNLEISDNGADSTNTITVVSEDNCVVKQESNTTSTTVVTQTASTGGNTASNNTGGDVLIDSGNATNTTTVTVVGGSNSTTNPCCCDPQCPDGGQSHSALITNNGADSTNDITAVKSKSSKVKQKTNTTATQVITQKAKTGKNKAKNNTGGTTTVQTGDASQSAIVSVLGGPNTLNP